MMTVIKKMSAISITAVMTTVLFILMGVVSSTLNNKYNNNLYKN